MSPLAQRLLTLVLFIIVMAGWAWVLNRAVPIYDDWIIEKVGRGGAFIILGAFLAVLWIFGRWSERRHREKRGIQS